MGSGDHTSVYLTGDFDYKTGKFDWHISGEMDWGFDFYAPQSMVAPDGRRLIVAWANEWEWMPLFKDWGPTYQEGWCGFFNVIREVRMCKDGTLAFVLVLILAGVLLMLYQLVPGFDLLWILRFSPAILIVLGIELLFYSSKPDAKVRFDWLSMLGCAFILCIVGTAAVLPTVWNLWGPEREHAASRIESEKVAGIYNALTGDPALKSRVANAHVKVWISHAASDSYALQAGDECALYLSFTAEYDSDEAFAADCQAVVQAADANGLGFTTYYFSSCDDLQEGTRYTLDCNAAFPVGLTAAQLAGRVEKEYYYDGSAFSTEADRDSYIRAQLENEIEQEYEATHDGESATREYLDSEVARRFAALNGIATPETAAA